MFRASSSVVARTNSGFISRMMSNKSGSENAGSIREAGGSFGKKEKAQEDQYFRQQQLKQLADLKTDHKSEIDAHKAEIKNIEKQMEDLKKKE